MTCNVPCSKNDLSELKHALECYWFHKGPIHTNSCPVKDSPVSDNWKCTCFGGGINAGVRQLLSVLGEASEGE